MVNYTAKKILNAPLLSAIVLINIVLLAACQPHVHLDNGQSIPIEPSTPIAEKSIDKAEGHDYRDSTLFFDKVHASLSMRATLKKGLDELAEGYKFQFRSRRQLPVKISNIVITVANKRIPLESGTLYLPKDNALIFEMSLADSQFIQNQTQAVFLFEYENDTKAALIEKHKLVEFIAD